MRRVSILCCSLWQWPCKLASWKPIENALGMSILCCSSEPWPMVEPLLRLIAVPLLRLNIGFLVAGITLGPEGMLMPPAPGQACGKAFPGLGGGCWAAAAEKLAWCAQQVPAGRFCAEPLGGSSGHPCFATQFLPFSPKGLPQRWLAYLSWQKKYIHTMRHTHIFKCSLGSTQDVQALLVKQYTYT